MSNGTKEDVYTLAGGDAVFQWPSQISQEECDDLKEWFGLLQKKLVRSVTEDVELPPSDN